MLSVQHERRGKPENCATSEGKSKKHAWKKGVINFFHAFIAHISYVRETYLLANVCDNPGVTGHHHKSDFHKAVRQTTYWSEFKGEMRTDNVKIGKQTKPLRIFIINGNGIKERWLEGDMEVKEMFS